MGSLFFIQERSNHEKQEEEIIHLQTEAYPEPENSPDESQVQHAQRRGQPARLDQTWPVFNALEGVCNKIGSANTASSVRGGPFERRDLSLPGWNSDAIRPEIYAILNVSCRK